MLDFYSIKDGLETPEYPEEVNLKLIGSLDLETFDRLSRKGFIEDQYSFNQDFRWNSEYVSSKYNDLKLLNTDTDVEKLRHILESATQATAGLIAFCD